MNRKLLTVALTVLVAAIMLAIAAPAVAAQDAGDGNVTVSLNPVDGEVTESGEQVYQVNVTDADNGIGAYEIDASLDDPSVGEITGYGLAADNVDFDNTSNDGETLGLEVALGDSAHPPAETDGEEFTVATFTVNATASPPASTGITVDAGADRNYTVAEPNVSGESDFYNVLNLPYEDASFSVAEEPVVRSQLSPEAGVGSPGGESTFVLEVANLDGEFDSNQKVRSATVRLETDTSVAQFTEEGVELRNQDLINSGFTEVLVENNGSELQIDVTYNDPFLPAEPPESVLQIADITLDVQDDAEIDSSTDIEFLASDIRDPNVEEYPSSTRSSSLTATFDMNVDFSDQEFEGDAESASVTVNNVDSDGQEAAVIVTYTDENGDLIVAGLETGTYDGESVTVAVEDTGGFSLNDEGVLTGEHTAHVLATSQLSGSYSVGDVVSAETAGAVIDSQTATVSAPTIADIEGLGIEISEGFTIGDGYPLNQGELLGASDVYTLPGITVPGGADDSYDRYNPVAGGQHVGLTGLPVQEPEYGWVNNGSLLGFGSPTQTVAVSPEMGERELTLDYSESVNYGLVIDDATITDTANITVPAGNISVDILTDSTGAQTGEVEISIDNGAVLTGSPTIQFELVWEAANPVEGIDVPDTIDRETDHRVFNSADTRQDDDPYTLFEAGATGISHADTSGDILGTNATIESVQDNFSGDNSSFFVWQDQIVTFETDEIGQGVTVYQTAQNEDGSWMLGDEVVDIDATDPGQVTNLDTSSLAAGQYFVTFGGNDEQVAVLDVHELNLDASVSTEEIGFFEQGDLFNVNVTSDDASVERQSNIEVWFKHEGNLVSDVVHVELEDLKGDGSRDVSIIPSGNLVGPGNYTATVLHTRSGVTTDVEFEILPEPEVPPEVAPADDVTIESPGLTEPNASGLFDRGDIIPIDVTLEGGNAATLTFGDAADQNVEIHTTVYDPTAPFNAESTSVTLYLNTYQIGHGIIEDGAGGFTPNTPSWDPGVRENAQHGFFTNPDDPSSAILDPSEFSPAEIAGPGGFPRAVNVYGNADMDIYGGSQGGAVLSPGQVDNGSYPGLRYDLHAIGDLQPHTETEAPRDDVNALDIEQRSTEDFNLWTAPGEGAEDLADKPITNASDIENESTITQLDYEEVTYTNAQGEEETRLAFDANIAEDDFLIVQANSSGIEGVLHEAVVRNNFSGDEEAAFVGVINSSDGGTITNEFLEATGEPLVPNVTDTPLRYPGQNLLDFRAELLENETSFAAREQAVDENEDQLIPERQGLNLEPRTNAVIAGPGENGNLQDFYMPYELTSGDDIENLADVLGANELSFDTTFELEPNGGEQENVAETYNAGDPNVPQIVNPPLRATSLGVQNIDQLGYVQRQISFDSQHLGPAGIEVPGEANYSLSGTSTMAPGTVLSFQMLSETGEETPFFKEEPTVGTDPTPGAAPATWTFDVGFDQTRDNVDIDGGTAFFTDVFLTGGAGTVPGGDERSGVVLSDPAVNTFQFNNQRINNPEQLDSDQNQVVLVEAFDANRAATIDIVADGEVIGSSGELSRTTTHEQIAIELDEGEVSENMDVTAEATVVRPESGEPALEERTATINVESDSPALFDVRNLDPVTASAQVGEGTTVTVSATVVNVGGEEATQDINLLLAGNVADTESGVTLGEGESQDVSFDVSVDDLDVEPGTYEHGIASADDEQTGGLTIEPQPPEPPEPDPASFEVISLAPSEATVTQGDQVVVTVAIQNVGGQEGSETISLNIDGINDSSSLTLAANESGEVTFTVDTSDVDAGDYTHTVSTESGSEASGSLTVEEPEPQDDTTDDNTTEDDSSDGSGAGFGVVVAALALLGAALLAMRRQVE